MYKESFLELEIDHVSNIKELGGKVVFATIATSSFRKIYHPIQKKNIQVKMSKVGVLNRFQLCSCSKSHYVSNIHDK
jgi:hypothetical protein